MVIEPRDSKRGSSQRVTGFGKALIVCLFVGFILLMVAIPPSPWDGSDEEKAITDSTVDAPLTPNSTASTPPGYVFEVGEVIRNMETTIGCFEKQVQGDPQPHVACDTSIYLGAVHIHFGDLVVVEGPAKPYPEGWYQPMRVLKGGVYFEGLTTLVRNDVEFAVNPDPNARYRPEVEVGEIVAVSYSFGARQSPAGEYIRDRYGIPITIYGNDYVEILTGPTQADPATGDDHFWCRVRIVSANNHGFEAWTYCEMKKLN